MNFLRHEDVSSLSRPRFQARTDRRGPWFGAQYAGECDTCGSPFEEDDEIRADGQGGWEAKECCDDD